MAAAGCNTDNDIIPGNRPTIEFDSPDGVYTVKVGHDVRINPMVGNAENAEFRWTSNGETVGTSRALVMNCPRLGSFYVMLTVTTPAGSASAEARIDVLEKTPPVIDLALDPEGIYILPDQEYVISPRFQHADSEGFRVRWSVDGESRAEGESFTFSSSSTGKFTIGIEASNADGTATESVTINVVDELPRAISFPCHTLLQPADTRFTFAGRPVVLQTLTRNIPNDAEYKWTIDGAATPENGPTLTFTPDRPGTYAISVTASGVTASMTVECVDASENSRRRPASASSSPYIDKVWEYIPAPGQFIGDTSASGGDMPGGVTTHAEATKWAKNRLDSRLFVSLGACCGYIVAGFDHSVPASTLAADIAVWGNSFDSSNEPGVVWVMQDVNGNGIPDDEWYELKGSEHSNPMTIQNYCVTYYRPAGTGMDVEWTDTNGNRGLVDYLTSYHGQASYFPAWVEGSSLTLRGTRLPDNGLLNPVTNQWATSPFAWGYADNNGSDLLSAGVDGADQCTGLKLSNATMADGRAINLMYVDFIMIQTGVMQQLGHLGESSTEVCGIADYSLLQN